MPFCIRSVHATLDRVGMSSSPTPTTYAMQNLRLHASANATWVCLEMVGMHIASSFCCGSVACSWKIQYLSLHRVSYFETRHVQCVLLSIEAIALRKETNSKRSAYCNRTLGRWGEVMENAHDQIYDDIVLILWETRLVSAPAFISLSQWLLMVELIRPCAAAGRWFCLVREADSI